jgi:hypothetical protein
MKVWEGSSSGVKNVNCCICSLFNGAVFYCRVSDDCLIGTDQKGLEGWLWSYLNTDPAFW